MSAGLRWIGRLLLAGLLAAALAYVPYQAYGPSGIGRVLQLERDLERLTRENEQVARNNAQLKHRIRRLQRSDRELERIARDELGLVRANDIIFQFE